MVHAQASHEIHVVAVGFEALPQRTAVGVVVGITLSDGIAAVLVVAAADVVVASGVVPATFLSEPQPAATNIMKRNGRRIVSAENTRVARRSQSGWCIMQAAE
jgi:hypothetical protein